MPRALASETRLPPSQPKSLPPSGDGAGNSAAPPVAETATAAAPQTEGPRAALRRARLLDAAETVFLRDGLRAASMDRIAQEAAVARATAYAYFSDKEAAFSAVAARLAGRLETAVAQELAGPGTAAARLIAALQAKHRLAWQVARSSPHAADLLAAKDRLAAPVFAQSMADITAQIAAALHAAGAAEAADWARLIYASAAGIGAAAQDEAGLMADLARATGALVRAALIDAGKPGPGAG